MRPPPSLQGASTLQQQGSDASAHTDNGDDDDAGQDDGGRARELYGDGNEVSARSSERTGCEGARPSAVPVCLRPCRDDALSDAVQVVAAWATAREAAAVAVPAMWPGAAMSRGLGVTRSALSGVAMRRLQRAARRLAGAKSSRRQSRPFRTNRLPDQLRRTLAATRARHLSHWGSNHPALTEVSYDRG